VINKTSETFADVKIVIMSYEAASKKAENIKGHFNCIIADEAHYLKSKDSQRAKTLVPLL
jgi:SNF2 family DNA or RNA helicase